MQAKGQSLLDEFEILGWPREEEANITYHLCYVMEIFC